MNVSSVNQAASVAQQALTSNTSGPVVDQTAKSQTKTHQNSPPSYSAGSNFNATA